MSTAPTVPSGTENWCAFLTGGVYDYLNKHNHWHLPHVPLKTAFCLCVSAFPAFMNADPIAREAVQKYGVPAVQDALAEYMDLSKPFKCNLPDNAYAACTAWEPCDFLCQEGYKGSEDQKSCVPAVERKVAVSPN